MCLGAGGMVYPMNHAVVVCFHHPFFLKHDLCAIHFLNWQVVTALLRRGADPARLDGLGRTAAMCAVLAGRAGALREVRERKKSWLSFQYVESAFCRLSLVVALSPARRVSSEI